MQTPKHIASPYHSGPCMWPKYKHKETHETILRSITIRGQQSPDPEVILPVWGRTGWLDPYGNAASRWKRFQRTTCDTTWGLHSMSCQSKRNRTSATSAANTQWLHYYWTTSDCTTFTNTQWWITIGLLVTAPLLQIHSDELLLDL